MRIREIRKVKNISRKALAEKLNISVNAIDKYENGKCSPSIESLIKMADIFGVSVDTLVGHDAELIDLKAIDENRKELINRIVYKLDDIEVAKLIGYLDK